METVNTDIWTLLQDIFLRQGIVVIIACLVIGSLVKHNISIIPNKYIPVIVTVCGAILSLLLHSFSEDPIAMQVVKGAILGWASTGVHQFGKAFLQNRFKLFIKNNSTVEENAETDEVIECVDEESEVSEDE